MSGTTIASVKDIDKEECVKFCSALRDEYADNNLRKILSLGTSKQSAKESVVARNSVSIYNWHNDDEADADQVYFAPLNQQ